MAVLVIIASTIIWELIDERVFRVQSRTDTAGPEPEDESNNEAVPMDVLPESETPNNEQSASTTGASPRRVMLNEESGLDGISQPAVTQDTAAASAAHTQVTGQRTQRRCPLLAGSLRYVHRA